MSVLYIYIRKVVIYLEQCLFVSGLEKLLKQKRKDWLAKDAEKDLVYIKKIIMQNQ